MNLIKIDYPQGHYKSDGGTDVPSGTVMGIRFSKVDGFFSGSQEIEVFVVYAGYGEEGKSKSRYVASLKMSFGDVASRNNAFKVLQQMDAEEVGRSIVEEKTLHLKIIGKSMESSQRHKRHQPFKPSGNVNKPRKIQPS